MLLVYGNDGEGLTLHVLLPFGRTLGLLECVDDECLFIGGDVDFWHRFNSQCCGAGVPYRECYELRDGVCQCSL